MISFILVLLGFVSALPEAVAVHQLVQLAVLTERLYFLVPYHYGHRQTSSFTRAHILLKHSGISANNSFPSRRSKEGVMLGSSYHRTEGPFEQGG